MANKVCVIANPVSGGGKGPAMAEALSCDLKARGFSVEFLITQHAGEAQSVAGRSEADCVVAVGGDGTANEVANGLARSGAAMAILPVGAVNVVARELGLCADPLVLGTLIAEGTTRRMDVGLCGDRRFLLGGGAGLDGAVVAAVHGNRAGKKINVWSYVRPTARIILREVHPKICVTVDGKTICEDGEYVTVGNCRKSSGAFVTTPDARIDDGLLDVCVLRDLSFFHTLSMLWGVLTPGFTHREDVSYCQGRTIELRPAGPDPVLLQLDGDPAGMIPVTMHVLHQALRVIAPVV